MKKISTLLIVAGLISVNAAFADDLAPPDITNPNANVSTTSTALVAPAARVVPQGLCIRVPWGPGKVKWNFPNPKAAGYSVKPETSKNLIWAAGSSQDIDGIYRKSWGCGNALKVPDNCTVTVNSNGSISSCCNLAGSLAGHKVEWVNPGAIGWVNCPLQ